MTDESRADRLTAVRDRLAAALADCESSRDLPGLSREYRHVMAEIDSLHTEDGLDVVDQLAKRRTAKGSGRARRSS